MPIIGKEMDASSEYGIEDRLRDDLGATCAVDPELFLRACERLEVWEDYDFTARFEWMCDEFEDDACSAMHRFLDVAVCLHDGTLAEFTSSNDEGDVVVPNAVFWAAATAWLDPETYRIDRREWFEGIMRIVAESGRTRLIDDED